MRLLLALASFVSLTAHAAPGADGAAAPASASNDDLEKLYLTEPVGPIKIGMASAGVITTLGPPTKKSTPQLEGATGLYVVTLSYPGLEIGTGAEKKHGHYAVTSIEISAPATLTLRGVGVGASLAALKKAWPKNMWAEGSDAQHVTIGSEYGGILFSLDHGHIDKIFVGAAAE